MNKADAPPPGWYPDPTGGSQLWWWDGLDWTRHRRAPPNAGRFRELAAEGASSQPEPDARGGGSQPWERSPRERTRDETAAIMAEVRKVARDEVDRAVRTMSDSARDATRRLEPLISQYGDRVMRWIRNAGIIVIVLFVLWLLLQTFAQASIMDWIGDRVDNLTGAGPGLLVASLLGAAGSP